MQLGLLRHLGQEAGEGSCRAKALGPWERVSVFGLVEKGAERERATGLFAGPKRKREGVFLFSYFPFLDFQSHFQKGS